MKICVIKTTKKWTGLRTRIIFNPILNEVRINNPGLTARNLYSRLPRITKGALAMINYLGWSCNKIICIRIILGKLAFDRVSIKAWVKTSFPRRRWK